MSALLRTALLSPTLVEGVHPPTFTKTDLPIWAVGPYGVIVSAAAANDTTGLLLAWALAETELPINVHDFQTNLSMLVAGRKSAETATAIARAGLLALGWLALADKPVVVAARKRSDDAPIRILAAQAMSPACPDLDRQGCRDALRVVTGDVCPSRLLRYVRSSPAPVCLAAGAMLLF